MITLEYVQVLLGEIVDFAFNLSFTLSAYPATISALPAAVSGMIDYR